MTRRTTAQPVPTNEVADRLRITRAAVTWHIRAGHLKARKVGRTWFVDPASLEKFCATYATQNGGMKKRPEA